MLVTGVNGLIGGQAADKFLEAGFKVRGTVRDTKKSAWISELFEGRYGKGKFELVCVPDMAADGAFDEVKKGANRSLQVSRSSS